MAGFLMIKGQVAARLFQQAAAQLYVDAIAAHPRRAGKPPHPALDQAHRILRKARITREQMDAAVVTSMNIFFPSDQSAAIRLAIERIRDDPRCVEQLRPLTVEQAFGLSPLP